MIGIAFRQLRALTAGTAVVTALLVLALLVHAGMARAVAARLTQACRAADDAACGTLRAQLWDMQLTVAPYLGYLTVTTVLVAVFWGAPMISREIESGTAALAWSQSVTRYHWFRGRLVASVTIVGVLGLVLGLAVTWWLASFDVAAQAGDDVLDTIDLHGPLLPALWITGLLIGVLIGSLVTRTLPAMAITAAVTFLAAIAVNLTGRPPAVYDELDGFTGQALKAFVVLIVGAVAAALAFRRIRHLSV